MQVTAHAHGTPSWFGLSTSDEAAALRFYGELFGWADSPNPIGEGMGDYHMQKLDGADVGAISQQQPDEVAQGIPPHWNVHLSVDNVDTTVDRVRAAGGQVLAEPFNVMEYGRMAVVADPTGGVVCLWQAGSHPGAGVMREPNSVAWAELLTNDADRAATFYDQALGLTPEVAPVAGGQPYTMLRAGGQDVDGVMTMTPEMGQHPPSWMIYFEVEDAAQCVERAQQLGATVLQPPTDIPSGRFAMLRDPQGAVFGVIKSAAMA